MEDDSELAFGPAVCRMPRASQAGMSEGQFGNLVIRDLNWRELWMLLAQKKAEDWLWMTASQEREKADKEKDKPGMVENTAGVGSKEEESRRKTTALKKNSLNKSDQRPSQMNANKCLVGVVIRTSLAVSWRAREQWERSEEKNGRDRCRPLVQRA